MANLINFTEFNDNGDEINHNLPAKWAICHKCEGGGYQSRIPGSFGADDLDEWFGDSDERDEFVAEYMKPGGAYDEHCSECNGSGKVLELDRESCDQTVLKAYDHAMQEQYEMDAMYAAERAMGA